MIKARVERIQPAPPPPSKVILEMSEEEASVLRNFIYTGGDWPQGDDPLVLNKMYQALASVRKDF